MKTFIALLVLGMLACPAFAAPIGTQTSQSVTLSATVDGFSYRVNSSMILTRVAQGMSVSIGPANLFSVSQPAGPENNAGFSETFIIPMSVIDSFY
ncbi:MAG: hypothetical protein HY795_04605 [Desulfovibrio sp.]|nr:hypothetical protein [Desulfovibrio sp.]MBI4960450.1 hypothetical protein [Desulfovibrio sp.]